MRRNICSHTNRNTRSSVYKKVWITGRKYYRLTLSLIKVRLEVYGIFIDIRKHFHGNLAQTCLCISHRSRAVTIHRTKVSVTVYQWISRRPVLCHIYKSSIDRAVSMRVIFTHGITNDTGTFTMRLIRTVVQLYHGIQYPSLYRFQTISDVRKGTGGNNTHGIIYIRFFHGLLQIHLMDFIKNIVFHSLFS